MTAVQSDAALTDEIERLFDHHRAHIAGWLRQRGVARVERPPQTPVSFTRAPTAPPAAMIQVETFDFVFERDDRDPKNWRIVCRGRVLQEGRDQ